MLRRIVADVTGRAVAAAANAEPGAMGVALLVGAAAGWGLFRPAGAGYLQLGGAIVTLELARQAQVAEPAGNRRAHQLLEGTRASFVRT